jgi:hypothetical protein
MTPSGNQSRHATNMVTREEFMAAIEHCLQTGQHELLREACVVTLLTSMTDRFGQLPASTRRKISTATIEDLHEWLVRHLTATTVDEVLA